MMQRVMSGEISTKGNRGFLLPVSLYEKQRLRTQVLKLEAKTQILSLPFANWVVLGMELNVSNLNCLQMAIIIT